MEDCEEKKRQTEASIDAKNEVCEIYDMGRTLSSCLESQSVKKGRVGEGWASQTAMLRTLVIHGRNACLEVRASRCFSLSLQNYNNEKTPPEEGLNPLKELHKLKVKIPKPNKMPPRPSIAETDIQEKFIKGGSGKGGQKINKTNSKVQLTHIPTGIVVTSQATRSREQNRKIARQLLAMKIEEMEKGLQSRNQLIIARKQMVKQRAKKKTRAKYKKLNAAAEDGGKRGEEADDEEVIVIVDDEADAIPPPKKEN